MALQIAELKQLKKGECKMKIIKTILYFIGVIYSVFLFLGSLISTIVLLGSTNNTSGKLIGVSICFLLTLLFGLLAILCGKKLYSLWHKIPNKPLDNTIPSLPEQTSPPSCSQTNLEIPKPYLQETITNVEVSSKTLNEHVLENSPSYSQTNLEIPNTYLQETITPNKNLNEHILENTTEIPQNIQYVNTGNTIYRADGKSITDEEVPYLIQVGYEEALKKAGLYNGQVLDQSFMQERDKNKKEYTRIPTYQELSKVQTCDSYVSLTELLFLNYINGLPLLNPFIAQKWYYEYNLHYTKTIINLISNGLLTVEHACIDKLKSDELKAILKNFNYPTNGKKEELLLRIRANISQLDIDNYFNNAKYFSATPKGHELIKKYKQ